MTNHVLHNAPASLPSPSPELDPSGATERDELVLLYQPTFDLRSGAVVGAEALVRWRHPVRGLLWPIQFIPAAEESGSIVELGRWVLVEACGQTAAWRRAGHSLRIAVNVSARQLERDELVDEVAAALAETGLPAAMLTLELTETALTHDLEAAARRLAAIKRLGVRIALDDFGAGYSSFGYLRSFPLDALKIDRSFVSGTDATAEAEALLRTLVQLGRVLGLETHGEGVEDANQLAVLQEADCDLGQGFLLGGPLAARDLERFLELQAAASGRDDSRAEAGEAA